MQIARSSYVNQVVDLGWCNSKTNKQVIEQPSNNEELIAEHEVTKIYGKLCMPRRRTHTNTDTHTHTQTQTHTHTNTDTHTHNVRMFGATVECTSAQECALHCGGCEISGRPEHGTLTVCLHTN